MASTSTFVFRHFLSALEEIASRADGRAHSQTAFVVFGRAGIFQFFLNVFYGDQALQVVLVVDNEQLFYAVLVQNFFGLLERRADRDGDEMLFCHHLADGDVEARLETQVAVGEDADQFAVFLGDGDAGNLVLLHHVERVGNLGVGRHGDRVDDHAAFGALDLVDFIGLLVDGEIAMDDAESALLGERDGHVGFGDRVHGGADDGDVEMDVARDLGLGIDAGGHNLRARGNEENVVESKGFGNREMNHGNWVKLLL